MTPTQHKIGGALLVAETQPIEIRRDTPDGIGCILSIITIALWLACALNGAPLIKKDHHDNR